MSDQKAILNPNTMSTNPTRPQMSRAKHNRQMYSSGKSHLTDGRREQRVQNGRPGG